MNSARTDETCPACGAVVSVPHTGAWVYCPHCGKGKLRWVDDDTPSRPRRQLHDVERTVLTRLKADLAELDHWVAEGLPGAARIAAQIKSTLLGLSGDD